MWILISLPITLIVYLLFPISLRIATGGVESKKATLFALLNSIVGYFIFTIFYIATGSNAIASAPAAFTYFWIAKSILTKPYKKKKTTPAEDEAENQEELINFWTTFNKWLEIYDYPFHLRPTVENNIVKRSAEMYDEEGEGVKVECLIAEGILRISTYEKIGVKEEFSIKKEEKGLKKLLKFPVKIDFVDYSQICIKKEWLFPGHKKSEYPKLLKKTLVDMVKFFECFKKDKKE